MKKYPNAPRLNIRDHLENFGKLLDRAFINLAAYAIVGVFICVVISIGVAIIRWMLGL